MTRRVRVLFLGGTIAMTPVEPSGRVERVTARLPPDMLLDGVAEALPSDLGPVRLESRELARTSSARLGPEHLLQLARAADEAALDGADGVVVVQGTDTLEESSWFVDLVWPHAIPVVFTGAMRSAALPGADGPANLVAAVAAAADPAWRRLGSLVALGDEIHAARHVAKRHTSSPAAFVSPATGPLGGMLEGRAVRHASVPRHAPLPVPERLAARVPVHVATLGERPDVLRALAGVADGLVVAGYGAGHLKDDVADVAAEIAARIPMVLASRTGAGSVHTRTYAGPGSEEDLLARGLVSAGHLDPLKARILLALLIARGDDRERMRQVFAVHGG